MKTTFLDSEWKWFTCQSGNHLDNECTSMQELKFSIKSTYLLHNSIQYTVYIYPMIISFQNITLYLTNLLCELKYLDPPTWWGYLCLYTYFNYLNYNFTQYRLSSLEHYQSFVEENRCRFNTMNVLKFEM